MQNFKLKQISLSIALLSSIACTSYLPMQSFASETKPAQSSSNSTNTTAASENSEASPFDKLAWQVGPKTEPIAKVATLKTLAGEGFLDEKNSDQFLELTDNLATGSTNILVAKDQNWWATFDFDESGYIKDDEKIDADALLKTIKDSDEASNEVRAEHGFAKIHTVGWAVPPHYDNQTKRLEWALKIRDDQGAESINYTIRLLGRTGVMNATLVSGEEELQKNIQQFKQSLTGFDFNTGQKYSEFREGDKVAEYGLAALITGGAVAVAAKKGLFATLLVFLAKIWKIVAIAVVALLGGIRSIFKRKKDPQ
ncbi:DUF2167 domain-containing protein [Acinetobacter gerneri]|uniref:DUF2167 domain-containing protein n=1 Tax=Acinetobacter gerneri TaxID=202952 RepID=A0AAW8JEZ9_9GAMM|nr:DUF2167 domain-containing protein [Acinetobacter gerneri]MDQ9008564.1 DUF2167 domain-containing protein [Acinetobacter gerneri]MDQ9012471.1 DUF2167 domain-containing protein [Acinetobacter gerneri]MDQ9023906.1 DUF2167 domain-containing protein [Acinetobacter gerneri]MDQ9051132.1 DUF2167 domain-containing protein [Acinetobacter gerneri]MDQ9058366.1 DUF2167 domain-containing protein [Acinetobacter gerneri]